MKQPEPELFNDAPFNLAGEELPATPEQAEILADAPRDERLKLQHSWNEGEDWICTGTFDGFSSCGSDADSGL